MPRVRKIEPALMVPGMPGNPCEKVKVAAYARVSTDQDAQLNSFEAQKDYYGKLIGSHADWEMVGIYADRGLSGTSSEKRPEFIRMMQDCRNGKIQMILTKSVSRFARNTVDSLTQTSHITTPRKTKHLHEVKQGKQRTRKAKT